MRAYVLRRLGLALPTLLLVSVLVFLMMRLMPGDVATRMVEGHAYAPTLAALRAELGLDRPAALQYLEWVGGILLRGDFGRSYWTRQPIWDEFVRRFPVTLELAVLTIAVSVAIGLVVGIVSAVRQDTPADYAGRILAILALSVPYFGLAVLVVVLPSIYFRWTPVWPYVPFTVSPLDNLTIMLVPAAVFGVTRAGPIMRIMRSCAIPWRIMRCPIMPLMPGPIMPSAIGPPSPPPGCIIPGPIMPCPSVPAGGAASGAAGPASADSVLTTSASIGSASMAKVCSQARSSSSLAAAGSSAAAVSAG